MTKQEQLLDRISSVGDQRRHSQEENEAKRLAEYIANVERIHDLLPRIKSLLEIAQALFDQKISIGNPHRGTIGYRTDLVSDFFYHTLGFLTDPKKGSWQLFHDGAAFPFAIGILGGGACGNDLIVTADGVERLDSRYGQPEIAKLKEFLNGFDDFESRVHEYVNNL